MASLIFSVFIFLLVLSTGSAQLLGLLSSLHYALSCPVAIPTIKDYVRAAVANESRMGASLIRLHFHDCFVNGCDGSVLLDDTESFTGEKTAFGNANSLRGFELIDNIKAKLEEICPGIVSCSDILTLAARDATVALGGPTWTVPLGRKDSTTASLSDANSNLPPPSSNLSDLITIFSNKGFTKQEMVTLSGAHTVGLARCITFRSRIYNETNIDPTYAASKQGVCPSAGGDNNLTPLDQSTTSFDNAYFTDLVNLKGLLHSDQELFNNGSTDSQVKSYSLNQKAFFSDFTNAMVKMGNLESPAGFIQEVRTNCRKINGS
ncbi:cationic peroxidase 1-like [Pistacia vera]|uniref:cationic peroxidase 1-like n=1 Tax=Pistacia vera TaxID=55513 RepID=UPI0012637364|nr:cationic peroxidase 1-like [Pistacia vera]